MKRLLEKDEDTGEYGWNIRQPIEPFGATTPTTALERWLDQDTRVHNPIEQPGATYRTLLTAQERRDRANRNNAVDKEEEAGYRRGTKEEEEDEDLQLAIQASMTGSVATEEKANTTPFRPAWKSKAEETEDKDLQLAIQASMTSSMSIEQRLDALRKEMLENANKRKSEYIAEKEKARLIEATQQGCAYNFAHPVLITVDLILPRIIKHADLSLINSLYRTSKNMASLTTQVLKRYPMKSLSVRTLPAFYYVSQERYTYFGRGPLYALIMPSVETVRFEVSSIWKTPKDEKLERYYVGSHIKYIIVSVDNDADLQWFRRRCKFATTTHIIPCYDSSPWRLFEEAVKPIHFASYTNFDDVIEK